MKTQQAPWIIKQVDDVNKPLAPKFLNNEFEICLQLRIACYKEMLNQIKSTDQYAAASDFESMLTYSFMAMSIGQGVGAEYFVKCLEAGHGITSVHDNSTNKPLYYLALSVGSKLNNRYCIASSKNLLHKSDKKIAAKAEKIANLCLPVIQKNKHLAATFCTQNEEDNDCITWMQAVGFSKIIDSLVYNNWPEISFWYAIPSSGKPASPLNILHLVELDAGATDVYIRDAHKNPYPLQPQFSTSSYYCDPSLASASHVHDAKNHNEGNENTELIGKNDGCFNQCTIL